MKSAPFIIGQLVALSGAYLLGGLAIWFVAFMAREMTRKN